jgi:hypothetical protein
MNPLKQQGWVMVSPTGNTDFRKRNKEKKRVASAQMEKKMARQSP